MIISFYTLFFLISVGRLSIKRSAKVALLGALTYPLYLTHHVAGRYLIDYLEPVMNKYAILFGLIIAALLVAYVITELIDRRFAGFLRKTLTRLLVPRRRGAGHLSDTSS